jgi:hypothetical protein
MKRSINDITLEERNMFNCNSSGSPHLCSKCKRLWSCDAKKGVCESPWFIDCPLCFEHK